MRQCLFALLLLSILSFSCPLLLVSALYAQPAMPPGFDPARHMRVDEVKDGMRGYGLSVFHGTKIDRFEVQVISVVTNLTPKHDVILIRCQGANLEHSGIVAGMSGSPIFLTDEQGRSRQIGALAYGFRMNKDPIAGVQPLQYMLELPEQPRPATQPVNPSVAAGDNLPPTSIHWSLADLPPQPYQAIFNPASVHSSIASAALMDTPQLRPLATPLMVSGIPASLFSRLQAAFAEQGMMPMQGGGLGGPPARYTTPAPLEPGSSVVVPLLNGDARMEAIGTVSYVGGNRVLAFGHPYMGEGDTAMPMSSGYVHTIISSLDSSMKLGAATGIQGTIFADQLTGIAGQIGLQPPTVPIQVRCVYADGSSDQTYRFSAVRHQKFTPLVASLAAAIASTSARDLPQYHTLDYEFDLQFSGGKSLRVANRSANCSATEFFPALGQPISAASENPFERVWLKSITGVIRVSRQAESAEILAVIVPRTKFRAGQTVNAFVTYRPFRGAEAMLPLTFDLPRDLPDGAYDLAVMDYQQHLADEQTLHPFRFTADNIGEVFQVLGDMTALRHDALYIRLMRQPDGVAIGRTAMPRLPSSRRRVMMGAGMSNTTLFVSSQAKSVATTYVMSGQAHFNLTIDKDIQIDTSAARPRSAAGPTTAPATP